MPKRMISYLLWLFDRPTSKTYETLILYATWVWCVVLLSEIYKDSTLKSFDVKELQTMLAMKDHFTHTLGNTWSEKAPNEQTAYSYKSIISMEIGWTSYESVDKIIFLSLLDRSVDSREGELMHKNILTCHFLFLSWWLMSMIAILPRRIYPPSLSCFRHTHSHILISKPCSNRCSTFREERVTRKNQSPKVIMRSPTLL